MATLDQVRAGLELLTGRYPVRLDVRCGTGSLVSGLAPDRLRVEDAELLRDLGWSWEPETGTWRVATDLT